MTWQIAIGLAVLTYSVVVLLQRKILGSGKVTPGALGIFFGLFCGIGLMVISWWQNTLSFAGFSAAWLTILIATVAYAVGGLMTNIALQKTEASKFTILFATRALIAILIAAVVLGESISWSRGLGAVLIFLGVAVTSWQGERLKLQSGDWLTLIAAVIYGIANVNDRFALQNLPLYPYLILAYVLPALLIAAVMPKAVMEIKAIFEPKQLVLVLLLSVLSLISGITFFVALQIAPNTAQVVSVNLTSVLVIVALSMIFLHERSHWQQKLAGAVITLGGLWLLG